MYIYIYIYVYIKFTEASHHNTLNIIYNNIYVYIYICLNVHSTIKIAVERISQEKRLVGSTGYIT